MNTLTCNHITADYLIIDTRSPKEFEDHHIPRAINVPLLDNLERHEVGYLYKQVSVKQAYEKGIDIISKKLGKLTEQFLKFRNKNIIVYCARGGLRSRSITLFLENLNFNAFQLEGGMKSYRNFILEKLKNFNYPKMIVLQGYTGTGKTKYIENLNNSIDLEKCANHQSSLFGGIGLKPNSQKMFTFLLYENLIRIKDEKFIFIEGEARKIGNVHIPEELWNKMLSSYHIMLEASIGIRTKNIVENYPDIKKHEEEYVDIIKKLKQWFSKDLTDNIVEKLKQGNYDFVVKNLLEKYYDVKYKHFMEKVKINETLIANDFNSTLKILKNKS